MTRPRPVLVCVDRVSDPDPALRFACAEAARRGRPVLVAHVVEDGDPSDADSLLRDVADRAETVAGAAVPVETAQPRGDVVTSLVDLSRGAALVVLQRRELTRLQRLVSRSVCGQVAGAAHAPTVSVPEGWHPAGGGATPRLVVGVDDDDDETAVLLRHAFARADEVGADVTVVHGWQLQPAYDDAILDPVEVEAWESGYLTWLRGRLVPAAGRPPTGADDRPRRARDPLPRRHRRRPLPGAGRARPRRARPSRSWGTSGR